MSNHSIHDSPTTTTTTQSISSYDQDKIDAADDDNNNNNNDNTHLICEQLKSLIVSYQDFPLPGVVFRDIFPIFQLSHV